MKQKLILVRGLPGSGKSTFAKNLYPKTDHFEADMFPGVYDTDGTFHPELLKKAHSWCLESVRKSLEAGKDVVVSNTFTMLWEMKPYIDLANSLGAELVVYRMTGNWGSIHGVPPEVMERMKNRFEDYSEEILK